MTAVLPGIVCCKAAGYQSGMLNPTRKRWHSFTNRTQHFYSLIDFLPVFVFFFSLISAITREEHKNTVQHYRPVRKAGRESRSQYIGE